MHLLRYWFGHIYIDGEMIGQDCGDGYSRNGLEDE
jgi:hypothetical protein